MSKDNFNENEADNVWVSQFGNKIIARDITGAIVVRNQHGDDGWHVNHIKPLSKGGNNSIDNLQVLANEENNAKGDDYPTWTDTKGKKHTQHKK